MDRAVQDKAFEPLLHVVRNAVAHGIESPADRVRLGKPASRPRHARGPTRGEYPGHRRSRTTARGWTTTPSRTRPDGWAGCGPDEKPSRERLHAFIFQPGFFHQVAGQRDLRPRGGHGRGRARGGAASRAPSTWLRSPGDGTQLTLRLPARLALEPALIVRVGGQPFAIPASQVEHAQPFEPPVPSPDATHEVGRPIRLRVPAGT